MKRAALIMGLGALLATGACKKQETVEPAVVDASAAVEAPPAEAPAPAPAAEPAPAAATKEGGDWIKVYANHNPPKPGDPVVLEMERFQVLEARFDPANLEGASAALEIDLSSLKTDSDKRDTHLRSPDYLDAEKFPRATVKVTDVKNKSGDVYTGLATIDVHGVTMKWPVEFKVTRTPDGQVVVDGEHKFKRTDFGVGKAQGADGEGTADEVTIKLHLTLEAAG